MPDSRLLGQQRGPPRALLAIIIQAVLLFLAPFVSMLEKED
jgi:hypothetical protein